MDLDDAALIYTATETGKSSVPTAFMTVDVARAYCTDPRSAGVTHGTRWATFWTRASVYFGRYNLHPSDLDAIRDDGRLPEYPRLPADVVASLVATGQAHHAKAEQAARLALPRRNALF